MDFSNNDYVFITFKKIIEAKGFVVSKTDEKGYIHVVQGDNYEMKVSLDNLRKEYEQVKEDYCIENFAEAIINTNEDLPNWGNAKENIFPSLFPSDFEFGDNVNYPITDEFSMIFVYDNASNKTWINEGQLEEWGIDNQTILQTAYENLDKVLKIADLEIDIIEGKKIGYFSLNDETMKSVLILSKSFKDKVIKELGWPVIAVIPVRDFCYIFSKGDLDFFADRLGATVINEYQNSGYPIATQILECDDGGIKAIGKYEIDGESAE